MHKPSKYGHDYIVVIFNISIPELGLLLVSSHWRTKCGNYFSVLSTGAQEVHKPPKYNHVSNGVIV